MSRTRARGPKYVTCIPADATERVTKRHAGGLKAAAEYMLRGVVVGVRSWDEDGSLALETPLKDGQRHGIVYTWSGFGGPLISAEPWVDGVPHGTTRQWSHDGRLIGTYLMRRGTGLDLWRLQREDGSIYLAEAVSLKAGHFHGFQWFINEDQRSIYIERHWQGGRLHGIWRGWNSQGRLRRGYPQYYVAGERVTKRQYLRASARDRTLPKYRERDNDPARAFPSDVAKHLRRPRRRR